MGDEHTASAGPVLGLLAVGAFVWTLRASQYDDIQGAAERILIDDADPDVPGSDGTSEP
jgi:cbb3-type cytochrome oxidase maturation protein